MLLEGIFAAVTTCFYPDGRPYWRKLEANMDRYSLTPMSGMVLLGSTGEAVMPGPQATAASTAQPTAIAASPLDDRTGITSTNRPNHAPPASNDEIPDA